MIKNITLICIPFAGGTSFAFRDINNYLPKNITPICIEYPGHGKRLNEPLLNDIHDLVSDIFHHFFSSSVCYSKFAIWGHSMGGIVAYLLTHRLFNAGLSLPLHLFVSGSPAPSIPRREKDVYKLPRDAFIEKVKKYGGAAEEVLAEKELMDLFIPILKSDFRALELYQHIPHYPLQVPITAMLGSNEHIKEDDVKPWQLETTLPIVMKKFKGNHFFIFDHLDSIGQMIKNSLSNSLEQN